MTGLNRNLYQKINKLLDYFPVVTLLGARQVGKTTLSQQLRPNWHYVDLEKPSDFALIDRDPEFFLSRYPKDLIIDEAQEMPVLFNILRGVIDQDRGLKGRYLITGSSSPELLKQISESLAGRVAIVEVGTLKANELFQKPLSDFYTLFQQKLDLSLLPEGKTPLLSRQQVHKAWFQGGYPEPSLAKDEFAFAQWMENYQATYINRDLAKLFPKLNRPAYQRFLSIISRLSGTILNKAQIARDIEVSETTVKEYLQIANGTYLWRQILSYDKNIKKAITKMPTGHLRDTGLLHYLLKITNIDSLYADPIIGRSFESFVIEELIKGLQATEMTNWDAYYYRTRNAAEIDLILDGPFGVLPIEIKYGTVIKQRQLLTLHRFIEEQNLEFGLVINQAERPEWLSERVFQLPVGFI